MQGLHNNSLTGDGLCPVINLSDFTTQCGIDTAMVTKLQEWSATASKKVHEIQTEAQHSYQQVKENLLSSKSCFIDLRCELLDGVSIGSVFHHPCQRCHRNRHH